MMFKERALVVMGAELTKPLVDDQDPYQNMNKCIKVHKTVLKSSKTGPY